MFMNDPDFDDEFQRSPGFEYGETFPSPDSKQRGHDEGGPSYGNSGMGTPQNGRARVLAQQREIQLKKRQSNLLSGGMVRSSLESNGAPSPFRQSTDNQYTPALRQFSAPKNTAKDPSYDASPEKDSEFTKKSRANNPNSNSVSRYNRNQSENHHSDEEDDARAADAHRRAEARRTTERDRGERDYGRDNQRDRDRGSNSNNNRRSNEGRSGGRRQFRDDDDDEEIEDDYQSRRSANNYNSGNGRSRNNNRDDDQHQAPSSSTYRNNNNGSSSNNNYGSNRDDDSFDGQRGYGNNNNNNNNQQLQQGSSQGGKWAGATGGREVYGSHGNTAPNSAGTDRDRNYGSKNEVSVVQHAPQATVVVNGQTPSRSPNPHSNNSNTGANPQSSVPLALVSPNLTDMRAFLCSPLPRNNGVLQCYIRRNKSGTHKLFPIYSLYLKEGDVFLMASKKRPKNKTSNYLISMDQNDLNRTGRGYLGKLRSNFVGTEFQVFDNGVNPKDSEPDEAANSNGAVRCELGSVMYAANVLGSRGPRKMQVALPGLDEHGRIMQWKDNGGATTEHHNDGGNNSNGADDTILTRMKDRNLRDLNYLINKPPRWNEQVGAYVLNFNGRVTMASVKNFQLVDPDEQNAVVLQFGRVGKDEFTMDLQHPISPFQAFAVTLSSFDSKIACD